MACCKLSKDTGIENLKFKEFEVFMGIDHLRTENTAPVQFPGHHLHCGYKNCHGESG